MPSFEYKEQESLIFGKLLRPLIMIEVYSSSKNKWFVIENVLADTGADISILPRDIGEVLISDVTSGTIQEIKGIVPFARLMVFIHNLKFRINGKEFELPVAIADSHAIPPILGRVRGLDIFNVSFQKGKKIEMLGNNE